MFLRERHERIIDTLRTDGRVTVSELAERFGVSADCIRKDLKALEGQGLCKRVYGGAINMSALPKHNVIRRRNANASEKRVVAERAYALIGSEDVVFLDESTTNLALADLLAAGERKATVVSNMIDALHTMSKNPLLTVIGTGGNVSPDLNGFTGASAIAMLEPMRFDIAFLGAYGIDPDTGAVTTFDLDTGLLKQQVMRRSGRSYLVADHTKVGVEGAYRYATLGDFTALVSDSLDPAIETRLEAAGARMP